MDEDYEDEDDFVDDTGDYKTIPISLIITAEIREGFMADGTPSWFYGYNGSAGPGVGSGSWFGGGGPATGREDAIASIHNAVASEKDWFGCYGRSVIVKEYHVEDPTKNKQFSLSDWAEEKHGSGFVDSGSRPSGEANAEAAHISNDEGAEEAEAY